MRDKAELSDPRRVLLWDLDGTLLDTQVDLATAINCLLAEHGLESLPLAAISGHVGRGGRNLVARCLEERGRPTLSSDEVEAALRVFERHYDRCLLETTRPYGNLDQVVRTLRERGRAMAIVSNKPEGFTRRILQGLDLLDCFDAVVGDVIREGGEGLLVRKPDPAPLLHALRLFAESVGAAGSTGAWEGVRPEDAIMIGDSPIDVLAGRRAGIPVCAVAWGFGPVSAVREADPDWWVETPEELGALLLGGS